MSLYDTQVEDILTRLNSEDYLAETKYKLDKLVRSADVVDVTLPLDQFHTFTENMVYHPNEIWIEWQSWTNSPLRLQGYCVKYENTPGDITKTLHIWCTKTNELVEVHLNYMNGFRWGDVQ